MDYLLLQIILARRNDDAEGWMNILFVIVLAVFWAIGGIIKAKANKSGAQGNQSEVKPARKPPLHSREAREQMLRRLERPAVPAQNQGQKPRPAAQKPRMKFADLQATVRKLAVEVEQSLQPKTGKPMPKPESPLILSQLKSDRAIPTEPISQISKGLEDKHTFEPEQMPESEYLAELLTDYSDPEELRRAILHYEILGKPLSLRDQD